MKDLDFVNDQMVSQFNFEIKKSCNLPFKGKDSRLCACARLHKPNHYFALSIYNLSAKKPLSNALDDSNRKISPV